MSNVIIPAPSRWIAGIVDESAIKHAIEDGAPRYGVVIWYADMENVREAMMTLLNRRPLASEERQAD
jgi:hypothetical protein